MIPGAVTGLSVIALGLSGAIALELGDWPAQRVLLAGPTPVPHAARHETAPLTFDIDRELSMILARPLFSPDRKPIGAGTKSIAGLSRLTGIVVTGPRKIAIFATPSGGRPVIAEEGSHIDAHEVKAISDTGVTVAGPNGTTTLTPMIDTAQPPASNRVTSALPTVSARRAGSPSKKQQGRITREKRKILGTGIEDRL